MAGSNDDIPPPPPPPLTQTSTQQSPHTILTIKLPILKKGEYDIWAMNMEPYLAHTDYPIWEVIQRGNGPMSVSTDKNEVIKVLPPKTAKESLAREKERKARTTLLMALPKDYLSKFHKMTDAKEMWEAIKSKFSGNDESKKLQKYILNKQFEGFSVSSSEELHKGYDRVFESNVKGSTASSYSRQNMAFISENTSSTNDLDEFDLEEIDLKWQVAMISMRMKKFYKKTGRKLQFNAKEPVGFDKTKVECYNCHKTRHFAKECRSKGNQDSWRREAWNTGNKDKDNGRRSGIQEEPKALVTLDGDGVDWTSHLENKQENYALMAYSNSGSDTKDYPQRALNNKGIIDCGCSRHMTGNKAYLVEYQDHNGGPVAFGGSKGYITGKGKIKTGRLDFEDVCFVKELQHFNLFSVSQMCDKKNKVHFTDTECLVLSPEFKLPDENQVLLKVPRQNNMYSFNLENIVPFGGLACLIAKATVDESNKWHRRLGHVNFKNLNKLVKGNLVRGLPLKIFQNDHTCVACQKGKQHKASCKAKSMSSISQPLQLLHMDLFRPTSVRSLNHKTYCLVITDDFSRFSWLFFLRNKDETSGILKDFIRQIENQLNQKVKTIICDNGTEFKNKDFVELCGSKGIKRSVRSDNKANKHVGPKEVNHSAVKRSEEMNKGEKPTKNTDLKTNENPEFAQDTEDLLLQARVARASSTNTINTASTPISTASPFGGLFYTDQDDSQIPALEDSYDNPNDGIFTNASYDDEGAVADFKNLETIVNVSPIPTLRIHSIHHSTQILRDPKSAVQIMSKVNKSFGAHVFILVDFPYRKKAIGTKWVYRNKKDERDVVVRNKARLVAQGHRQEEGIDYDEVFAPVARIKAVRIFLAFTSYMGFIVNQIDVKSAFLYGTIDEEVYVSQPLGFVDPKCPKKVYKVMKALYGLHQAPRACVKTASTPIKTQKPLVKDEEAADVDVHLYRSMISSLMYLTASRHDIMFAVCACSRFQPKLVILKLQTFKSSEAKNEAEALRKKFAQDTEDLLLQAGAARATSTSTVNTASTPVSTASPSSGLSYTDLTNTNQDDSQILALEDIYDNPSQGIFSNASYDDEGAVADFTNLDTTVNIQKGTIDKTLFIKKDKKDIMLVQVYVDDIIFGSTKKSWCEEFEALMKSRFQMSSIGELTFFLGLQEIHNRSVIFLQREYISWQCKKQTIVATSTTEAEYVAAANCCGQVLWIQNQMLDYGFNFMNTKIYNYNKYKNIVKNPVFHSKTKHIEIQAPLH
ncbi:putative ribonuclease H-like domain-containing protein [Tanacetum coccineum]